MNAERGTMNGPDSRLFSFVHRSSFIVQR